MICMYCKKGELQEDTITRSYEKNGVITVIRGVPVRICDCCGQEYLDQDTVRQLENIRKNGRIPGLSMGVFNYSTSFTGSGTDHVFVHE